MAVTILYPKYLGGENAGMQCFRAQFPLPITTAKKELMNLLTLLDREVDFEPTRVEFIWEAKPTEMRGALLYGADHSLFTHLPNALIGYNGSGAMHSRTILEILGVPDALFQDINESVRGVLSTKQGCYLVVCEKVDQEWRWQRVI